MTALDHRRSAAGHVTCVRAPPAQLALKLTLTRILTRTHILTLSLIITFTRTLTLTFILTFARILTLTLLRIRLHVLLLMLILILVHVRVPNAGPSARDAGRVQRCDARLPGPALGYEARLPPLRRVRWCDF